MNPSSPSSIDSVDYGSDYSPSKISIGRVGSLEEGEEIEEDVEGMKFDKEHMMRKSASSSDISKEQGKAGYATSNIPLLRALPSHRCLTSHRHSVQALNAGYVSKVTNIYGA